MGKKRYNTVVKVNKTILKNCLKYGKIFINN